MSAFGDSQWQKGFPFSATNIRTGRRLRQGSVNYPEIADARQSLVEQIAAPLIAPVASPAVMRPALRAGRPIGRQGGMRLLPLQAFVWGSRANPPQPRTRPDHLVLWVTEGRVQLDFPKEGFRMRPGDLCHIPAGTAFAAVPDAGARGHVALISTQLAAGATPPLPERGLVAHVGDHAGQLETTLRALAEEVPGNDPGALSCLINLLSLRLRQLAPHRPPEAATAQATPDRPLIERFQALARLRLGEARSVAELAAELQTTTLHLDQACLAAYGKRAVALIHDLQLERAVDLLRNSIQPTQRIAAELGFSSHAHFVRAFVASTGRTPDLFRAQGC